MDDKYLYTGNWYKTEDGKILHIAQDDCPQNPREWDGWLGKIFSVSRYVTGETDKEGLKCWDDLLQKYGVEQSGTDMQKDFPVDCRNLIEAAKEKGDVLLPMSIYDHSGITLYVGLPSDHFDGRWDCSFVGFMIADGKDLAERKLSYDDAVQILEGEVAILDCYYTGSVYGYILYDAESLDEIDSCWGFFGSEIKSFEESAGLKITENLGSGYSDVNECFESNRESFEEEANLRNIRGFE